MFFRLVELIIALYYGALDDSDDKDTATLKTPMESSVDRDESCTYFKITQMKKNLH